MTRALLVIAFLVGVAGAAFMGQNAPRVITSAGISASDTAKPGGTQIWITVSGDTAGAFVTLSPGFPCVARRDSSSVANASFFLPRGTVVVRGRGGTGRTCVAATAADSGSTVKVRFETGFGAP